MNLTNDLRLSISYYVSIITKFLVFPYELWDDLNAFGLIQTLFLWNLKSFNFGIWTRPLETTSKMSQKPKIWRPVTFKKCSKFSVQSFGTLTHNCGKSVVRIKLLTGASERGLRDLPLMVLWRYTNIVTIWVFMIPLNWWNRRLFKIRNHK